MKKLIIIALVLGMAWTIRAQHNPQYSQFIFNKLAVNPAYAGSKEALSVTALYRHQWQGVEGAPRTMTAFAHMPFFHNRCGAGVSVTADKIGMLNTNYATLSYAYRLPLRGKTVLSAGLHAQFEHSRLDWTKAQILHNEDNMLPMEEGSRSNLNFGLGIYYSSPHFYAGFSMPQILRNTLYGEYYFSQGALEDLRSYYLMTGFVVPLSENVLFKPAALVSYNPSAPFELDVNLSFLFMNSLWVGATYRLGDSVDAMVQFQFSPQLKLGLAADFTLTELQQFTAGSFEVMLEYTLIYNNEKLNNIRFF